jgi:hypothetical protein
MAERGRRIGEEARVSSPAAKGEEVPPVERRGAHTPGVLRYVPRLYLATFLALLGFACAQELWVGFWQDRCSFGSVSNERYRELLRQAQAMRRTQGALLDQRNAKDPLSGRLRSANELRLAELAKSATSLEERIATAHAMMRAERFMLKSTWPDDADPYRTATTLVAFDYERFHLFGLAFLCLIDCKDRASVNLRRETEPGEPSDIVLRNRRDWLTFRNPPNRIHLSFTSFDVESLTRSPIPAKHAHECPPIPPGDWKGLLPTSPLP